MTEAEESLRSIWMDLLKVPKVDLDADFFHVGGHSLLAVAMARHIRETMHTEIYLIDIFERRTIRELAAIIEAGQDGQE
jgi:acyl carrier protein